VTAVGLKGVRAVLHGEWTKIRSVRSTYWTLLLTFVLSVGLGSLFGFVFRTGFSDLPAEQQRSFDPLFATFYSLTLGQLPLVVFGVLVVGGEYGSGTIRISLAAVPRRGLFYAGKVLGGALPAFGVSVATVLATFAAAQAALGPYGTSLGADGVLSATVGACLYLTLICLFATGIATMLRSSARSLAILLPVLFLGSQGLGNVPMVKTVAQYLPDQAGMVIIHVAGQPDDPRFGRDYGPWTGLGLLVLWVAAALAGGYWALRTRDA
jgi:ABC-2 type transport system permease protein